MTAARLFDEISIGDTVRLTAEGGYSVTGSFVEYLHAETDTVLVVVSAYGQESMRLKEVVRAERLYPELDPC